MSPPTSPHPSASPHHPNTSRARSLRRASVEASPRSPQQIFNEIVYQVPKIKEFTELVYEDIDPDDGSLLCLSLVEDKRIERRCVRVNFNAHTRVLRIKVMPTRLHDVHQRWATAAMATWALNGLLNQDEVDLLCGSVGSTFTGFAGNYRGSSKEPDYSFCPNSSAFPSLVIEAGGAESFPHLRNDKDLWMDGLPGMVEVWRRNGAGGLSVTEMPIFPRPVPQPASELVQFTKGQLFGPMVIAGQDPSTVLSLGVARLGVMAEEVMTMRMGLTPA
ncbi:hypothetical protein KXW88_004672 [Aspergillus fumigatus]|nr:hypothetical protein KXW88_004672 [Aspergillus fumigatus]KAH2311458.1 hypothetical protein KXV47_004524 [Aspergillus fumigatus]